MIPYHKLGQENNINHYANQRRKLELLHLHARVGVEWVGVDEKDRQRVLSEYACVPVF